jgi:hypothetical protein
MTAARTGDRPQPGRIRPPRPAAAAGFVVSQVVDITTGGHARVRKSDFKPD